MSEDEQFEDDDAFAPSPTGSTYWSQRHSSTFDEQDTEYVNAIPSPPILSQHAPRRNKFLTSPRQSQQIQNSSSLLSARPLAPSSSFTSSLRSRGFFQYPSIVEREPSAEHRAEAPAVVPIPDGSLATSAVGEFASLFSFPYFNVVQSKCFDVVFSSDENVVVSAPTGSGKTVLFELAFLRLFKSKIVDGQLKHGSAKAIYIAPLKALVSEKFGEWEQMLSKINIKCVEVTGDTSEKQRYEDADLILTTPEKWDSLTRKAKREPFLNTIQLVLIDEVHILNEERGASLEAIISRMKTVFFRHPEIRRRFLAVSATAPNLEDLGAWLDVNGRAILKFDDSFRPVPLKKIVLGFPNAKNSFLFDRNLNYKLFDVVTGYNDEKPTLLFCSTRKECINAATQLTKDLVKAGRNPFIRSQLSREKLMQAANQVIDKSLQETVKYGVGIYHAGLEYKDRRFVEDLFMNQDLQVVCTTSSLSQGVNLPAHLVVIKSTEYYKPGAGYVEHSDLEVIQMIGRAGRPKFDVSGTAVILTREETKRKWDMLLSGQEIIESTLDKTIIEHINAEICLGTIRDFESLLQWLKSTFFYVRAKKNPKKYGLPTGLTSDALEKQIQEICKSHVNSLVQYGMAHIEETTRGRMIKSDTMGYTMAKYMLRFDTFKKFATITEEHGLDKIIDLVSEAAEFENIILRRGEKKLLNDANKQASMRFQQKGNIKTAQMKINCLMQATLSSVPIKDFSLQQESNQIFNSAVRICRCMVEYLVWKKQGMKAIQKALDLSRAVQNKIWENSPSLLRQLDRIGSAMSQLLANAGITTFTKLEETQPRMIEGIVGRHPPFGSDLINSVRKLPRFSLEVTQNTISQDSMELLVHVVRSNTDEVAEKKGKQQGHALLIIGDDENLYASQRINPSMPTQDVKVPVKLDHDKEIKIRLVNEDLFGLDVEQTLNLRSSRPGCTPRNSIRNTAFVAQQHQDESDFDVPDFSLGVEELLDDAAPTSEVPVTNIACKHNCKDKHACKHQCCKTGLALKSQPSEKALAPTPYQMMLEKSKYLPTTPVKRLRASTNTVIEDESPTKKRVSSYFPYSTTSSKPSSYLVPSSVSQQLMEPPRPVTKLAQSPVKPTQTATADNMHPMSACKPQPLSSPIRSSHTATSTPLVLPVRQQYSRTYADRQNPQQEGPHQTNQQYSYQYAQHHAQQRTQQLQQRVQQIAQQHAQRVPPQNPYQQIAQKQPSTIVPPHAVRQNTVIPGETTKAPERLLDLSSVFDDLF